MLVSSKIPLHPQATTETVENARKDTAVKSAIGFYCANRNTTLAGGGEALLSIPHSYTKLIQALDDIARKGYAGVDKILFMESFQIARKKAMKEWGTFFKLESNVTNGDLESDREVEHFVEPYTPALSRLSHHTSGRGTPGFNMALTNHAESN